MKTCISAVQHLRPLRGGAQAHLLRASDGACYVTKFQNNPQHIRVLANEMLATNLGLALGLPMPRVEVIEVSDWLIEHTEDLRINLGGAARELFEVQYPAPGDPTLARRVQNLLAPLEVKLDNSWGLDHGTWSVLRHVYPDADIPVVQLSIDENKPASFHFEIGKKLALLREEGILVVGSGNLVHNLHAYAWGRHMPEPYDWAVRFERDAKEMMVAGEYKPLIEYENLGPEALLSIPTPDHYLPMLYVIATRQQGELITFPIEGVDGGSISMLTVQVG